jgi:hypothetical protein
MFPSHCRIYRILASAAKPMLLAEITKLGCCDEHTAGRALNDLRSCGLVHICKWKRKGGDVGGAPLAMWQFGQAIDAPRPAALDLKACKRRHYHKRKDRIIQQFGDEVWNRIRVSRSQGGADKLVVDGKTVYQRGAA